MSDAQKEAHHDPEWSHGHAGSADQGGAPIPEFAWKWVQGILSTVMIGVIGWAWNLQTQLIRFENLQDTVEAQREEIAGVKAKLEDVAHNHTQIQLLDQELEHISKGVEEIKALLKD